MSFCKNCGKELNGESFCPSCGQAAEDAIVQSEPADVGRLVCPKCGSKRLQLVTETNVSTSGKNYSGAKGCLGYLMFGPLGMLCGSCGQSQKTTTTHNQYWVCKECGEKFKAPDELRKEIEKNEKLVSLPMIILLCVCVAVLIILGVLSEFSLLVTLTSIYAAFMGILFILLKFVIIPKNKEELRKLEEAMDRFRR